MKDQREEERQMDRPEGQETRERGREEGRQEEKRREMPVIIEILHPANLPSISPLPHLFSGSSQRRTMKDETSHSFVQHLSDLCKKTFNPNA